jgi:hypothetical protein
MVIKGVISDDDARTRIAQLRAEVIQAEHELLSLEEVPRVVALRRAALGSHISTLDRVARVLTRHAEAADDRGPLVTSFRASGRGVTINPKAPGEGFEVEVKGRPL